MTREGPGEASGTSSVGIFGGVDAVSVVLLTIVAMVVWGLWLPFQLAIAWPDVDCRTR